MSADTGKLTAVIGRRMRAIAAIQRPAEIAQSEHAQPTPHPELYGLLTGRV